jgi:hypothetical protein
MNKLQALSSRGIAGVYVANGAGVEEYLAQSRKGHPCKQADCSFLLGARDAHGLAVPALLAVARRRAPFELQEGHAHLLGIAESRKPADSMMSASKPMACMELVFMALEVVVNHMLTQEQHER